MRVAVTISFDTAGLLIPVPFTSIHAGIPAPPLYPHIEPPLPTYWPPGVALGQGKFTNSVKAYGRTIALQGHNLGCVEPHIPLGPATPGLVLTMGMSSKSFNFSASKVRMDGSPTGAQKLADLPMSVCSLPCSIPGGFCDHMPPPSVFVGLTPGDLAAGNAAIAVGTFMSFVTRGNAKLGEFLAGQFRGAIASVVSGAAQVIATGQGTVGFSFGYPPLAVSVGVAFQDGKPTSVGVGMGPGGVQYTPSAPDGQRWQASQPDPNDPAKQQTKKW